MVKFNSGKPLKLVVKGASVSVIPNPQGIPMAVNMPGKTVNIPQGNYETNDQEIIDKIRGDIFFGTPQGIIEITEDEMEAIKIRERKHKEADEEIKEAKRKKQQK